MPVTRPHDKQLDLNAVQQSAGLKELVGGIRVQGAVAPGGISVTAQGATGATTYGYQVSAVTPNGEILSAEVQITDGNDTLTGSNFNRITWNAVAGALSYRVYRTTADGTSPTDTGLIANVPEWQTRQIDDTGLAQIGDFPQYESSADIWVQGDKSPSLKIRNTSIAQCYRLVYDEVDNSLKLDLDDDGSGEFVSFQTILNFNTGEDEGSFSFVQDTVQISGFNGTADHDNVLTLKNSAGQSVTFHKITALDLRYRLWAHSVGGVGYCLDIDRNTSASGDWSTKDQYIRLSPLPQLEFYQNIRHEKSEPLHILRDTARPVTTGGLFRWKHSSGGLGAEMNTAAGGDFSTLREVMRITLGTGNKGSTGFRGALVLNDSATDPHMNFNGTAVAGNVSPQSLYLASSPNRLTWHEEISDDSIVALHKDFVVREVPSGAINGSNVTFTLAATPVTGKEAVYLNGLLQDVGAGNDYTISGATITFNTAPQTGDKLLVSYMKS